MVVGDYGQPDGKEWHGVTTYTAYRFDAGIPVIPLFIHGGRVCGLRSNVQMLMSIILVARGC